MARRYFPGKSQVWLEARLSEILDEQASGKVVTSFGTTDVSSGKSLDSTLTIQKRRTMILNDLSILDAATYPPEDNKRVTRTRARVYNGGNDGI